MLKAAAGPIPKDVIVIPMVVQVLTALFNQVFELGALPEDWKVGQIVNLFKKGDPSDPGNYRGITLLSVVGKLLTRIMSDRLSHVAESLGWLVEEQGGFRPNRRTEDQALILHRAITNRRLRGKDTFVFFLDMRKAYDTVWRDGLVHHLDNLGVNGKFLFTTDR
jgi:hypothetical protein